MSAAEAPAEVAAIALRWGGRKSEPAEVRPGVWRFAEIQEDYGDATGFVYEVYAPGTPFPCFEDSGRPCGDATFPDKWTVRAVNDAPDGWFQVDADGTYRPYGGPEVKVW